VAIFVAAPVAADTPIPPEARSRFDKAEIAREEGRMEDAAALYLKAIEAHPLYLKAHSGYLASLRGVGDLSPARSLYEKLTGEHAESVDLKICAAAALEPAEAIEALEEITSANPANVRGHLELARAFLSGGDARKAETAVKKALKLDADLPLGRVLLGDCYLMRKSLAKARKAYLAAVESDPAYVPGQLRLAICLHRMKKSNEALELLGKLVSEENLPNVVAGHWILAVIRVDLERYADALKAMDKVLAIDKDDYDALLAKGQILLQSDKPVEAVAVFKKAAELYPRRGEALFCLGWAHEKSADAPEIQDAQRKDRLVAASEAYFKCAEMDPGVRPRDSLGFVYLLGEEHQEAVIQFKRATGIDPKFAPAMNNLGLAADIADNRSDAKKKYQHVLGKIDKVNVRAHVMLALDLWLDGSHSKAIKELDKALKINDQDDLAWTFLGDVHYDMRKHDRAIRAFKEAVAINEKNFTAWYHMGIAYEDKRRYEDADASYRKALESRLDPPAELYLRLGILNDEQGLDRLEDALKFFTQYVEAGGTEDWIPERIEELKEILSS
jgi:tetratricopeptide (TPR) repeat protein